MSGDRLPALDGEAWPERARVRGVAPIGIGTGWVEAASGLMVRTAAANRLAVRPFVERVLAEAVGDDGCPGATTRDLVSFGQALVKRPAAAINGSGTTAREWTRILGRATLQPDLHRTTLLPWGDRFSARGLLRDHRAFCPVCLFEWARGGSPLGDVPVWEPLRWQIKALRWCVRHGLRLREDCPTPWCGRKRAVVAGWASTERCVGCRLPFARSLDEIRMSEPPADTLDLDYAAFVDAELSEILARPPDATVRDASPFSDILAVALESVSGGAQRVFAERIGMTEATVSYWKDGHRAPTLDAILRVCRAAGFRLRDVLLGDLEAVRTSEVPSAVPYVAPSTETHHVLDGVEMERILEEALVTEPPPTLASIYADSRVNPTHIRRRFPVLCAAVRERRRAWEQSQRSAQHAERSERIRSTVETLTTMNVYPSKNQVRKVVSANWLRRPELSQVWREAVIANGWDDPALLERRQGSPIRLPARR